MNYTLDELTLELTKKCFQNCAYCSSSSGRSTSVQLRFDTVKQVLDDFYYLGGRVLELSGGEPLSYGSIHETIEYASKRGFQIRLFTCAYLPSQQIDIDRLDKVDRFYVNLQAPSKAVHDYLTKTPGSFDRVVSFIKELKTRGKWIGTHLVPTSLNIDEIEEYFEFARLFKLDNVSLLRFVQQGRGRNCILSLNSDEILQLFSTIEKYRHFNSPEFKIGCPLDFGFIYTRSQSAIPCESGIHRCVIRPNGNVIPCPAFKDSADFLAGNVNKESLVHIWNTSDAFRKVRGFRYERLRGLCKVCSFLDVCKGRCHAQRWHCYGNLYSGHDPYCPLGIAFDGRS